MPPVMVLFVYLALWNTISPAFGSFQSGSSSSIGVLSTASFATESAQNLPFDGVSQVYADCGWSFAAAGTTAPGFYLVPNFGSFNLGVGNVGQSNVGVNNIGFGNYGTENVGRLNCGNGNVGYTNDGNGNTGALNTGNSQTGDTNTAANPATNPVTSLPCIGYNNTQCSGVIGAVSTESTYSVGTQLQGSFLFGSSNAGTGLVGSDSFDEFSVGFQNENGLETDGAGNIGVMNTGVALVGYNNTGDTVIGQGNEGANIIGLFNDGALQIGYNNTGTGAMNIGFNQIGSGDVGVDNAGDNNTGFALLGNDQIGGTYIDTSSIPLSAPILFDPAPAPIPNVGTSYSSPAAVNETRLQVNTLNVYKITARYSVTLVLPAVLSVVDLGCPVDLIRVYNSGVLVMTTVAPRTSTNPVCVGLNDPDSALADPNYSRGFVTLPPGCHILSFDTANGGTSLAFRLDYVKTEESQKCTAPVPPQKPFNDNPLIDQSPPFEQLVLNCNTTNATEEYNPIKKTKSSTKRS